MLSPASPLRDRMLERVNARYEAFLAVGFPITLQGNAETLQLGRDVDRTNWLTLLGICYEAIAAEFGDYPIPDPGIRTTSNTNYVVSFNEAAQIIRDLRTWGLAAWANWGRMKDEVRTAPTRDALQSIDLEEGWP